MSNQPTTEVADGDCFPVAYRLAIATRHVGAEVRLCHGTVVREHDGLHHSHAWVELTATYDVPVLDTGRTMPVTLTTALDQSNGHNVELPAVVYRKAGQAHDVVEYEPMRAMTLAVSSGHYGPWPELVAGVDYDPAVCDNCGEDEHTPAELAACIESMVAPVEVES